MKSGHELTELANHTAQRAEIDELSHTKIKQSLLALSLETNRRGIPTNRTKIRGVGEKTEDQEPLPGSLTLSVLLLVALLRYNHSCTRSGQTELPTEGSHHRRLIHQEPQEPHQH